MPSVTVGNTHYFTVSACCGPPTHNTSPADPSYFDPQVRKHRYPNHWQLFVKDEGKTLRSVNVVVRKFDVPLPCSPRRMHGMVPAPYCSMKDVQDDSDDFEQLQFGEDDRVTSFGVDVYQQVFPVGATAQGLVGGDVHPQRSAPECTR